MDMSIDLELFSFGNMCGHAICFFFCKRLINTHTHLHTHTHITICKVENNMLMMINIIKMMNNEILEFLFCFKEKKIFNEKIDIY